MFFKGRRADNIPYTQKNGIPLPMEYFLRQFDLMPSGEIM